MYSNGYFYLVVDSKTPGLILQGFVIYPHLQSEYLSQEESMQFPTKFDQRLFLYDFYHPFLDSQVHHLIQDLLRSCTLKTEP